MRHTFDYKLIQKSLRIVFMGNPEFSVPSLSKLFKSSHTIITVVTNPAKPLGRGRKYRMTPVAKYCKKNGIPLFQPESIKSEETINYLKKLNPDLFVIVAFKILPKWLLEIPQYGSINLHGSLLPKYRGAAPIQWALIHGMSTTGLSIFFLKPAVDTGDILLQKKVIIFPDDNFGSLSTRMSIMGADLLINAIEDIVKKNVTSVPQDNSKATKAPKITPNLCQINWKTSARDIHNLIRALSPVPGAYTFLKGKRLKIFKTYLSMEKNEISGSIFRFTSGGFMVSCGVGSLDVIDVQYEGKRRMSAKDFLLGMKVSLGERLID